MVFIFWAAAGGLVCSKSKGARLIITLALIAITIGGICVRIYLEPSWASRNYDDLLNRANELLNSWGVR